MNEHNFDNFSQYFNKWQKNIINTTLKRSLVNKELENYIKSFQNIDSEIYKSLFTAKEFNDKKQHYYSKKIKRLKQKEIEFKQILNYANEDKHNLIESKAKDELSSSINYIKQSLEEIESKIDNLNSQIEEQALDIDEENNILEDLKNLDRDKQINLRHLKKLEQDLFKELQINTFYKAKRTVEILELNLKQIPRNHSKWSKRKVKIHKKMLDLYRKAKEFEFIKKQIEKELIGAKQTTEKNLQYFYKQENQSKKKALQEQLSFFKNKAKTRELNTLKTKYLIKRKKTKKKYAKEKLSVALEKQRSGKKLDFYELKLILDYKKNKK
jgi:hypothetical protein